MADEVYRQFVVEEMSERKRDAVLMTSTGQYAGIGATIVRQDVAIHAHYRAHAAAAALRLARLSAPAVPAGASLPDRPATVEDPAPLRELPEFPGNEREMAYREAVLPATLALAFGALRITGLIGLPPPIDLGVGCAVWVIALILGLRWLKRRVTAHAEARRDYYRRHRPW